MSPLVHGAFRDVRYQVLAASAAGGSDCGAGRRSLRPIHIRKAADHRETRILYRVGFVMHRGGEDVPVRTASAAHIVIPGRGPAGDATETRYFPAANGTTAHLESVLGDGHMDYNDGPNDAPDPDNKEWDRYTASTGLTLGAGRHLR